MSDWKYDVEDVGEDADADDDADVPETLEPGSPSAESAFFVALGVAATLFVFAQVLLLAV
ncbi:hypothetical protein BRC82_01505 [Halobacteriales archaeon QS_1_67_19]|nr:MAG: hypothetical protein BRC82_01505 [Halobacteriales archaeon QS_1_67_19]